MGQISEKFRGKKIKLKFGSLDLSGLNITDIAEIKEPLKKIMKKTKYRYFKGLNLRNNQISELSGFEFLSFLEDLLLSNNQISEIKGLDKIWRLKTLELSNNQISEIKGLEKLSDLQDLRLTNNKISEIKGLEKLTNLTVLRLSYNQISEIKGLVNLRILDKLELHNNRISEIKGLNTQTFLKSLTLNNNPISELKGLENQINLSHLSLDMNRISEVEEVKNLSNLERPYKYKGIQKEILDNLGEIRSFADKKYVNHPQYVVKFCRFKKEWEKKRNKLKERLSKIDEDIQEQDYSNKIISLNSLIIDAEFRKFPKLIRTASKKLELYKELKKNREIIRDVLSEAEKSFKNKNYSNGISILSSIIKDNKFKEFPELLNKAHELLEIGKNSRKQGEEQLDNFNRRLHSAEVYMGGKKYLEAIKELESIKKDNKSLQMKEIQEKRISLLNLCKLRINIEDKRRSYQDTLNSYAIIKNKNYAKRADQLNEIISNSKKNNFKDIEIDAQEKLNYIIKEQEEKRVELKKKLSIIKTEIENNKFKEAIDELTELVKETIEYNLPKIRITLRTRLDSCKKLLKGFNFIHELPQAYMNRSLKKISDDIPLTVEETESLIVKMIKLNHLQGKIDGEALILKEGKDKTIPQPKEIPEPKLGVEPVIEIIPDRCIACHTVIAGLNYECPECHVKYDLTCARALKSVGQSCFNLNCTKPFPAELDAYTSVDDTEIETDDPIIVSISKMSSHFERILNPKDILSQEFSSQLARLKSNLSEELKHKMSQQFYDIFKNQIEILFTEVRNLSAKNIDEIDGVKQHQNFIFQLLIEELKALRSGQVEMKDIMISATNKIIDNQMLAYDLIEAKNRDLGVKIDNLSKKFEDVKQSGDSDNIKEIKKQLELLTNESEKTSQYLDLKFDQIVDTAEEILNSQENIEKFLKKKMGPDWQKVKSVWKLYKSDEITLKEMIKRAFKGFGKRFINKLYKSISDTDLI